MLKLITLSATIFTFFSLSYADVNRGSKGTDFKGNVVGENKILSEQIEHSGMLGKWVSQNMDGSAMLFVVSKIEVDFNEDKTFVATVYLDDGGTDKLTGTYHLVGQYVYLNSDTHKKNNPYKLNYLFVDPGKTLLRLHDENFGVTLMMTRPGDLDPDSGGILGGL